MAHESENVKIFLYKIPTLVLLFPSCGMVFPYTQPWLSPHYSPSLCKQVLSTEKASLKNLFTKFSSPISLYPHTLLFFFLQSSYYWLPLKYILLYILNYLLLLLGYKLLLWEKFYLYGLLRFYQLLEQCFAHWRHCKYLLTKGANFFIITPVFEQCSLSSFSIISVNFQK